MSILGHGVPAAALVALLAKATTILSLAAIAQLALRRRGSAAARHGVWTLAVASLLLLPPLSLNGPVWPVRVPVVDGTSFARLGPVPASDPDTGVSTASAPAAVSGATAPMRRPAAEAPRLEWSAMALFVYAAGALLLLARLVADQINARRLVAGADEVLDAAWTTTVEACARSLGVTRHVALLRAAGPVMPMAVGMRRPAILIPEDADGWTAERRRTVILHELAHIDRRDCLTQTLASLATALYWPHPGVWWAARRLQVEREFACDDRVLGAGAAAGDYASDLLEIAYTMGARRAPALAVTMARRGQLEGRLLAVLDAARNRATPGVRSRLAAAVATLAIVVPVAAVTVSARAALPAGIETPADLRPTTPPATIPAATPAPSHRALAVQVTSTWASLAERAVSAVLSENSTSGTWSVQTSEKAGEVYLEMRQDRSSSGRSMPLSRLEGLSSAQIAAGGAVKFLLRRDAGTFTFEGLFREGVGGGTYTYAANPSFPDELAKRGVSRPTAGEQDRDGQARRGTRACRRTARAGLSGAIGRRPGAGRPSRRLDQLRPRDGSARVQGRHPRHAHHAARSRRDAGLRARPDGGRPAKAVGRRPRARSRPWRHARLRAIGASDWDTPRRTSSR